jgi:D-sedoheptulose 7-phosphate isomerase
MKTQAPTDGKGAAYFDTLHTLLRQTECSGGSGATMALEDTLRRAGDAAREAHAAGNKMMFIGNGGSAGICSHMATDFSKNGGVRAIAFNDGSALTCLGNDLGYENVFAKQVEWHARGGDILLAISSSGKSPNILRAVEAAKAAACRIVTFSGFNENNPLRRTGEINFYIRSSQYGFVELAHQTLIHAILDIHLGPPAGETTQHPRKDSA